MSPEVKARRVRRVILERGSAGSVVHHEMCIPGVSSRVRKPASTTPRIVAPVTNLAADADDTTEFPAIPLPLLALRRTPPGGVDSVGPVAGPDVVFPTSRIALGRSGYDASVDSTFAHTFAVVGLLVIVRIISNVVVTSVMMWLRITHATTQHNHTTQQRRNHTHSKDAKTQQGRNKDATKNVSGVHM